MARCMAKQQKGIFLNVGILKKISLNLPHKNYLVTEIESCVEIFLGRDNLFNYILFVINRDLWRKGEAIIGI